MGTKGSRQTDGGGGAEGGGGTDASWRVSRAGGLREAWDWGWGN